MNFYSLYADGTRHRTWRNAIQAPDKNAYLITPGTPVLESNGQTWSSDYPVIAFFSQDVYFQVFLLLKADSAEYYCNIITPVTETQQDIWFIDLAIDVLVNKTEIQVVDEDEFEQRCLEYRREWIYRAVEAKEQVVQLAKKEWGPFHPATVERWRDWAGGIGNSGNSL